MAVYEIEHLSFSYPGAARPAVAELSLTVEAGDFWVLCGSSGSGKTTLLRLLKSALAPEGTRSGALRFFGAPLERADARAQAAAIGFLQQSPESQLVTDKVWHELAFGAESLGLETAVIRRRVAETAAFFGMEGWLYRDTATLSGGQKQLLNLASVMVLQPEVLILDEPTAQLDPVAAENFLAALERLNRELGTTVLLAEQRLEQALALASRVAVLEGGRLLCAGTPRAAGRALAAAESDFFCAMPTPMRVWAAADGTGDCPVTVSEGRLWLERFAGEHPLRAVPGGARPAPCGEPAVEAENLWFRYAEDGPDVLRGLTLSVRRGETLALLGGNGAGKTTLLRLLAGLETPLRGTLSVRGRVAALPQNPKALFVKKTVRAELLDAAGGDADAAARVAALCRLGGLTERHPYDLSGGEQQRAALAVVLLAEPAVLLLDEPTKGLDAAFKRELADILRTLTARGVAVVLVSHDTEFCARYAQRCALLFDGGVAAEGAPEEFFAGNRFYTTAANRMARARLPAAVTAEDVLFACGVAPEEEAPPPAEAVEPLPAEAARPRLPGWRRSLAWLSGLAAGAGVLRAVAGTDLSALVTAGGMTALGARELRLYAWTLAALLVCACATYRRRTAPPRPAPERQRLGRRTAAGCIAVLLLIPATLLAGVYIFGTGSYYALTAAVLLEAMAPFFLVFEGRRPRARELATLAVLCALGVAGRAAFFMLPQFKPVAALCVVAGVAFGGETGFLVGAVSMLLSNVLFSQGPWTPFQMFGMGLIGFFAGLLARRGLLRGTRGAMCVYGALAVLVLYGGILNPATALIWGGNDLSWATILTCYLSGFPMDCIHAAATVFFLWFAGEPMLEKLERLRIKYGLRM